MIRLAHKYDIQAVQDQALAYIQEHCYTTDFAIYSSPAAKSKSASSIELLPVHSIGAVNLARLTDTPSILPLALYHCASLGSALLDGWTRENGIVEHLAPADLRWCLDACVALAHEHFAFLSYLLEMPITGCKSPQKCIWELNHTYRYITRFNMPTSTPVNWRNIIPSLGRQGMLCQPCMGELLARDKRERKKFFKKLLEIFGVAVEGWGAEKVSTTEAADEDN